MQIKNCEFVGVQWDEATVETIDKVAEGLLNLTKLFTLQNIRIDSMIKIEQPSTFKVEKKKGEEKCK